MFQGRLIQYGRPAIRAHTALALTVSIDGNRIWCPMCNCRGSSMGPAAAGGKGAVSWDPNQEGSPDDCIRAHIPRVLLSTPLPLRRDIEERITSLGPASCSLCCSNILHMP